MAVSKPDFTRQFGSAKTDLTPISNANYLQGWDFVGSTPPTKNDFTYLQFLADQRIIWLYENYGAGRLLKIQVFTSSGTYTPTPGTNKTFREVLGAGGGGGGVSATANGNLAIAAGGGSGGYCAAWVLNPVAATVTVGIGGAGGIGSTNAGGGGLPGSDGGASTIGSLTANGGKGGQGNGTTTIASGTTTLKIGAEGGTATGGDINMKGNASPMAVATTTGNSVSGYGAPSIFGGGNPGGFGGTSSNGVDAAALGAGGSGAYSTQSPTNLYNGGKGGNGMIRIWEFA